MGLENYLQFLLFTLSGLAGICVLIFVLRQHDTGYDYDKIISELNKQKENDLQILKDGNKEINEVEEKILECKKELKMKLFDK